MRASLFRRVLQLLLALTLLHVAYGQNVQPDPPPAAPQPADPLKRDSPYGTIAGFLQAAGDQRYSLAVDYLQTSHEKPTPEDETTARQLATILNQAYFGGLDTISRNPNGDLEDDLAPERESIGKARTLGGRTMEIRLVQVPKKEFGKIWLVSSETLRQIPEFHAVMPIPVFSEKLPKWMVQTQLLSMTVLEWLLFLLAFAVAWLGARLIVFLGALVFRRYGLAAKVAAGVPPVSSAQAPITLALTLVLHFWLVIPVLPLLYMRYYRRLVIILWAVAFYWLICRLTDHGVLRIQAQLAASRQVSANSLLILGRRIWKVLVAFILLLLVMKSFGFEVNSALAGLGIGGIVLGFGAQKTLENLFGGVLVLSDGTLRVGDFCKVGDQVGTVEDIGLRATRIRTNARTLVSVPNGIVASMNLENFTERDKILFNPTFSLRYETSPDQLRYVIAQIRQMLYQHPKVEPDTLRVRFTRFGISSLDLEVFAYVLSKDYPVFLAIQEDMLLRIMDIVEAAGTGFAFSSQTTYLGRDRGIDPEKTKAAVDEVARWRQEKRLPFPDHDPDTIARLRGTLDPPPPESGGKTT